VKILIFGGAGQLGFEILKRAYDLNFEVVSPVLSEVDVTNQKEVNSFTDLINPDLIINCAAYTNVDKAEEDKEAAFLLNADAAGFVAEAAKRNNARIFHISTDYVFSGNGSVPLKEEDPTGPLGIYGKSKLKGEELVQEVASDKSLIIRTSSLFGVRGINFVGTMLKLFAEKEELNVVSDQFMSPTWAGWLSEILLDLARIPSSGVLHATNGGVITWFDFANKILELSKDSIPNARKLKINPVSAKEFARPAPRPAFSVLDTEKLTKLVGRKPMSWEMALEEYLKDAGVIG